MIGFWLDAVIAGSLAMATQGGTAADGLEELGDDRRDMARMACGNGQAAGAPLVDARGIEERAGLEQALENVGGQAFIIYGGRLAGQDMRPLARLLAGSCFYETDLSGTLWEGALVPDIRFARADLSRVRMAGTKLKRVVFRGANLSGGDLSRADLSGGEWVGADWGSNLGGASFRNADLTGFRFRCGITMDESCGTNEGAIFDDANLRRADLATLPVWGFDSYAGARFDETRLGPRAVRYLEKADFPGPVVLASIEGDSEWAKPGIRLSPGEVRTLQAAALKADRDTPSFDCAEAGNDAERLICSEYESELRRLDRDMAQLFREALDAGATTLVAQRAWLGRRNRCGDSACISDSYRQRMTRLFSALGTRLVLAPDESRTYSEDVLPLPDAFRSTALYKRIVPALEQAGMQHATLTGSEDGGISAEGSAVGGNAHLCHLGVSGAIFDPATAWYSARLEDGTLVPLFRVWRDRLMFRYSGNYGNTPEKVSDFMSCGARAGFQDMRDLSARE